MKSKNYKPIGDYIQPINKKNEDLQFRTLLGLSIEKKFIPSIASINPKTIGNYRYIKKNQFAYSPVTSRNGDKITIALLQDYEEAILSPAYKVFEVKNQDDLLPEYLFIWFNRSEFDRYARFHSWGSARETFTWEDMCNVKLPIPDIEVQKAIVTIYHTLETRKQINEGLKDMIKQINSINNAGIFRDFTNGGPVQFKELTFIYGLNTKGKTTLIDIFSSLKELNVKEISLLIPSALAYPPRVRAFIGALLESINFTNKLHQPKESLNLPSTYSYKIEEDFSYRQKLEY